MKQRSAKSPAFTLVELLVVMAIIAILAGLVLSTAGYVQKKAARSRAEAEIKAMEAAMESYKADNGIYPSGTTSGTVAYLTGSFLYQALTGDGDSLITGGSASNGKWGRTGKVYFEPRKEMLSNSGSGYALIDPFGYAYGYRVSGSFNTATFDLWSTGGVGAPTSGTTKSEQWIKNW